MEDRPSVGLPDKVPDHQDPQDPHRNVVLLATLTMIVVVFLTLIGQGCPPREAVTVTVALGLGGAEAARRLANGRDDGPEGGR
jgi:hypothetical protein